MPRLAMRRPNWVTRYSNVSFRVTALCEDVALFSQLDEEVPLRVVNSGS
jgi:hypothetical protein